MGDTENRGGADSEADVFSTAGSAVGSEADEPVEEASELWCELCDGVLECVELCKGCSVCESCFLDDDFKELLESGEREDKLLCPLCEEFMMLDGRDDYASFSTLFAKQRESEHARVLKQRQLKADQKRTRDQRKWQREEDERRARRTPVRSTRRSNEKSQRPPLAANPRSPRLVRGQRSYDSFRAQRSEPRRGDDAPTGVAEVPQRALASSRHNLEQCRVHSRLPGSPRRSLQARRWQPQRSRRRTPSWTTLRRCTPARS